MAITYSRMHVVDDDKLVELFLNSGLTPPHYKVDLFHAVERSDSVITAWDGLRLVGLMSAISDKVMTVFFNFIVVDPAYRGQNIGRHMVEEMLKTYQGFSTKVLVATDADIEFYKKCGFVSFEGKTPLIGRQGL